LKGCHFSFGAPSQVLSRERQTGNVSGETHEGKKEIPDPPPLWRLGFSVNPSELSCSRTKLTRGGEAG